MSCAITVDGPCRRTLRFSIDRQELDGEVEQRLSQLAQRAAFKGFRPGKAPKDLVRRQHGERLRNEARQAVISRAFHEAVGEHKLTPVGDPELDLDVLTDDGQGPFTFALSVEVAPEIALQPLDSLPVSVVVPAVDEAMVESEFERLRRQGGKLEEAPAGTAVGRESVLGATLVYVVDGEALAPRENCAVLPAHDLIDGAHAPGAGAAFLEHKPGDTVEFELELPAHFEPASHAGRRAAVRASITSHRIFVAPAAIDPELLSRAGVADEQGLRGRLREQLAQQRASFRDQQIDRAIEDVLLQQHPLELPERLLQKATERRVHEFAHKLVEQQQMSSEQGHTEAERRRQDIASATRRSLHLSFLFARIAREQSLGATAAEAEEQVRRAAENEGGNADELIAASRREGWLADVAAQLTEQKTRAWLRERAVVTESTPPAPVVPGGSPS
ncbi:MAG: trigger factor [Planctomycetota bacterium]